LQELVTVLVVEEVVEAVPEAVLLPAPEVAAEEDAAGFFPSHTSA